MIELLHGDWLVAAPVALALGGAGLCAVFFWKPLAQTIIGLIVTLAMVATAGSLFFQVLADGPQVMPMSSWIAPFGIIFAVDLTGAGLALLTAVIGFFTLIYSLGDQNADFRRVGYTPMLLAMLGGVSGAFLTGDIFNLYVWFEVLLIGSFGLLILGGEKEQLDGAMRYATLNLLATTFFLVATGLLYGLTGTLNMADLAGKVAAVENRGLVAALAAMYLLAFGMKAAAFPLFFWLPASYHTPRPGVSAVFGGLLTKVGVYALFRTFTLIFPLDGGIFNDLFMWIAAGTILFGGMGAMAQWDLRRVIAFTIVGGIGYMLAGLSIATPHAMSGALFYIVHSMLISTGLFMAAGIAGRIGGGYDTRILGGIYRKAPVFAGLFLLGAFVMSGIPPFSGFWPKVVLVQSALEEGHTWLAAAILVGGFLTLLALARAFAQSFWRDAEEDAPLKPVATGKRAMTALLVPTTLVILGAVALGFAAGPIAAITSQAGADLIEPSAYIDAVMDDDFVRGGHSEEGAH